MKWAWSIGCLLRNEAETYKEFLISSQSEASERDPDLSDRKLKGGINLLRWP